MENKNFLYSMVSGLFFGFSNILIKIILEENVNVFLIFLEPLFLLYGFLALIAFLFSQLALKKMKGSNFLLLLAVTATVVSVTGGFLLGEVINSVEMIGIMLTIFSVVVILTGS
jgi:drug/metabolite transporter (DMT)-like permease